LAQHIKTGKKFAVKIISKTDGPAATDKGKEMIGENPNTKRKREEGRRRRRRKRTSCVDLIPLSDIEIEVLKRAKHSSIIRLHDVFETDDEIYLVLDLVEGGELFDQIVAMSSYSEESAAKVVRQLTSAIQHLHFKRIVHRDLKPENLLLSEKSDTADVMLADFGLAALMDTMAPLRAAVGTPGYIAPEVLLTLEDPNITYDYAADVFGIGVIMYILLCGFPPFYAEDDDDLFDLTIEGDYSYPSPFWDHVSAEAKDLIDRMLQTDPKKRYTCEQILKHPWLTEKNNTTPMLMAQEQLKQWRARRRWKKGMNAIMAAKKFNFGKSLLDAAKASTAAAPAAAAAAAAAPAPPAATGAIAQPTKPKKKVLRVDKPSEAIIRSIGDAAKLGGAAAATAKIASLSAGAAAAASPSLSLKDKLLGATKK
jgi:serine/threonine protein kinase